MALNHCLSLSCTLDTIEPTTRTEGPRGTRLQINYPQRTHAVVFEDGTKADVLSGADFMMIRTDGVLELDGRVTIRTAENALIDLIYSGVTDLHAAAGLAGAASGGKEARFSEGYQRLVGGTLPLLPENAPELPLRLSVEFETATGPWSDVSGVDMTWVKERYDVKPEHIAKYSSLVRKQHVAAGTLTFRAFRPNQPPFATSITLDVSEFV